MIAVFVSIAVVGKCRFQCVPSSAAPHEIHVALHEPVLDKLLVRISFEHSRENGVGFCIRDSKIAFVGLVCLEIRAGCLFDQRLRHAEIARQRPHLRFIQIADRIDRRRVVRVPCEVSQQAFRFISGTHRQRFEFRRLIEEHDHAHPGHDIPAPPRIGLRFELHVAVDRGANIDRSLVNVQRVDNQLRVG